MIGFEELEAVRTDDDLWSRLGAHANGPEEHVRVEGEYLAVHGIDQAGLVRYCEQEGAQIVQLVLVSALTNGRGVDGTLLQGIAQTAYKAGVLCGIEAARRDS